MVLVTDIEAKKLLIRLHKEQATLTKTSTKKKKKKGGKMKNS